jgi:phosphoribosylaminoimidazole (AIR) synthetase
MGVGMMMVVAEEDAQAVVESLRAAGENASIIGKTVASESDRVIIHGNI